MQEESNSSKEEPNSNWQDWHWQLKNRITNLYQAEKVLSLSIEEKRAITHINNFKFAITPHLISIMDKFDPNCSIRKQLIPSCEEMKRSVIEVQDPLSEDKNRVAPGLVHRYPDRVLLLVTDMCAAYCRFCTRKRLVSQGEKILKEDEFKLSLSYLKENKNIRDVLISGGDPLILEDEKIEYYISKIREIEHVEIIRIGTRVPVNMPQRITEKLCQMLKKYHPLYISIHFNNPKEISQETKKACEMLANAGIPLGSQTVLLKGINDKPQIMMKLVHELLKIRVKPYYIYQCDLVPGTEHFRTPISVGIKIIQSLRGFTSGYAVPTYVIDAPGGGGKVPIYPEYVISKSKKGIIFKNYEGKVFFYPEKPALDKEIIKKEIITYS